MGELLASLLLVVLGLFLVSAGIEDVRTRNIANWKNAAVALLAVPWWWANGLALWPDLAWQLGLALLVFAVFAGAFWAGQMGGGDVKLIAALALWLPATPLVWTLIVMSLLGGAITLALLLERLWKRGGGGIEVPYGVAIAIAGLLTLREPIINQFG
jgi:prepilin peptidase CpaA